MKTIRVALSMRVTEALDYDEPRDALSQDWALLLDRWGMAPLPVPNVLGDPAGHLEIIAPDLLILTGGDDSGRTPGRDRAERKMLAHALAKGLPVLGVCRGMHLINDHFGGTTTPVEGHVGVSHRVSVEAAWRPLYGADARTNSFHSLAMDRDGLGRGLAPAAADCQGRIEAFFHVRHPLAAVMWHPERRGAPQGDRELISRLAGEGAFWR